MQVYLKVWRQRTKASRGHFADYSVADVSPDMSFLEMLDLLNPNSEMGCKIEGFMRRFHLANRSSEKLV